MDAPLNRNSADEARRPFQSLENLFPRPLQHTGMDGHQKHEEARKKGSYGDCLIQIDVHLVQLIGRASSQTEMDYIANLQEEFLFPREAAWTVAKESFFQCVENL